MKKTALLGILSVLVVEAAGCLMGPNYKRPTVSVPTGYRSAIPDQPAAAASLGNEKWWDVYQDPVLADLIHTALQQNYDVRIAASRVLEAQAQLGITRANQFPSASVGADIFSQQNGKTSNQFPPYQVNAGQLNLSVIWNLDFWGKYRRQTEAARAQMLASEWGQRAVISSLVANVATAYFQLRALDSQLEIAKNTLGSRQQSLQLTRVLVTHGSASDLDVSKSSTRPQSRFLISSGRSSSKKICSASCWAKIPVPLPAVRRLRSSPCPRPFPQVCLQNCSNVARTFGRRKKSSWQPTRKLVLPKLPSFPASPSLGREG